MVFQFPDFAVIYLISAILCFMSAAILWRRRVNPGSTPFALSLLSLAVWSFASIFEAGAVTPEGKIFWSKWQYLGITTVSPLWLLFSAQYTNRFRKFPKILQWMIWIIPVLTLVLAFTNEMHQLIWTNVTVLEDNFFIGYYQHGVAFFVHTAFSYVCLLIGTIWLVVDVFNGEKKESFQSVVFVISVILGWTANLIYILQLFPIPGLDITPITISFIALIMVWTISRFHVFDLLPIARESLLASMQDGVIVIDPNGIVLEINPAALTISGYAGPHPVGLSIWEVFDDFKEEIEILRDQVDVTVELDLSDKNGKIIEVQVSSIEKKGDMLSGLLIILRDITSRKWIEKKEQEQKAFVKALADTAATINQTLELDEVLERILDNVGKVVPHDSANIALMNESGQARFVKVNHPEQYGRDDYLTGLDMDILTIENFRIMADTGNPVIVFDTHAPGQWTDNLQQSKWIRSFLGAPISYHNELLGFINLDSGKVHSFNEADADRLEIFAEYAATAISNARNFAEIKFYAEEMTILYEISLAIAAGVGLEKTTQAVFRQLKRVIPVDIFYLALYEPDTHMVSYFMFRGNDKRVQIEPFNLLQRPSMTRFVIEKREKVYIPDFKAPDAILKEHQIIPIPEFEGRTALAIPLILRGRVIGALAVESEKVNAYSSRQIKLVETIAQQATIAMDNAKLFERLQQLAITDGLTDLYNRRYFYMMLENEIDRSRRYETPLSLIMMDIDHFKKVNDQYGHLAGDNVLKKVSELSKGLLRQADEMFRYGGEEFTILLPETNNDMAEIVAERIRNMIEETTFKTKKGDVHITVSLGVTEFDDSFKNVGAFIETVDAALYDAKKAGRNCTKTYHHSLN